MFPIKPSNCVGVSPFSVVVGGGNTLKFMFVSNLTLISMSHCMRWYTLIPASSTALSQFGSNRHQSAAGISPFFCISFSTFSLKVVCAKLFRCLYLNSLTNSIVRPDALDELSFDATFSHASGKMSISGMPLVHRTRWFTNTWWGSMMYWIMCPSATAGWQYQNGMVKRGLLWNVIIVPFLKWHWLTHSAYLMGNMSVAMIAFVATLGIVWIYPFSMVFSGFGDFRGGFMLLPSPNLVLTKLTSWAFSVPGLLLPHVSIMIRSSGIMKFLLISLAVLHISANWFGVTWPHFRPLWFANACNITSENAQRPADALHPRHLFQFGWGQISHRYLLHIHLHFQG